MATWWFTGYDPPLGVMLTEAENWAASGRGSASIYAAAIEATVSVRANTVWLLRNAFALPKARTVPRFAGLANLTAQRLTNYVGREDGRAFTRVRERS